MREMYLTYDQYVAMGRAGLPEKGAERLLAQASRHIDSLTFSRIPAAGGISALSLFRQETIRECVADLAEFECANADVLGSVFASYSINGVSMSLGSGQGVCTPAGGITLPTELYSHLAQTGLCVLRC